MFRYLVLNDAYRSLTKTGFLDIGGVILYIGFLQLPRKQLYW